MERGYGNTGEGDGAWANFRMDDDFDDLDEPEGMKPRRAQREMRRKLEGEGDGRLMTRREKMRSMREAETLRAIETLDKAGLFIPMDGLELWHGRYRSGLEREGDWEVSPGFNNAGNMTGNRNINKVPGLNTGDAGAAGRFAQVRANERNKNLSETGRLSEATRVIPEIHRIECEDPDAQIIDADFSVPGDLSAKQEIWEALKKLSQPVMEKIIVGDDVEFPDGRPNREVMQRRRERTERVGEIMKSYRTDFMYDSGEIYEMARRLGFQVSEMEEVMQATNTVNLMVRHPGELMRAYMDGGKVDATGRPVGMTVNIPRFSKTTGARVRDKEVPFSGEFLREWMKAAHVIGMKVTVESATLRRELMRRGMDKQEIRDQKKAVIANYVLFDMREVRTNEKVAERREGIEQDYGATARALGDIFQEDAYRGKHFRVKPAKQAVKRELMDVYGDSAELVRAATAEGVHGKNFLKDAGNWEGYSLGEHTETVLEYFNEVWADEVPSEIIPTMKLAILVHDLGKPEAAERGKKEQQTIYNVNRARNFMEDIGVTPEMSSLITGMIGYAQKLTSEAFIKSKNPEELREKEAALKEFCRKMMENYLGRDATDEEVKGLERMCVILQTCDSGAYTSRATTRVGGARMRNAGAFDKSFNEEGKLKNDYLG